MVGPSKVHPEIWRWTRESRSRGLPGRGCRFGL